MEDNRTVTQNLLGEYLDALKAYDIRPTKRFIGQLSKAIKRVVDEKQPPERVAAALREMAFKGSAPSEIDNALVRAARKTDGGIGLLRDFMDENGGRWPTGVRLMRGTHGATGAYDPLGFERVPADWPHAKPTADEVRAALRAIGWVRPEKVERPAAPVPEPEPILEDRRRDLAALFKRLAEGRAANGFDSLPA